VDGHYLYLVGGGGLGGLVVYSIQNPAAPVYVSEYQPYYYHDLAIRNDTVCATGIYGDGIDLIDFTNKSSPQLVSHWNYAGSGAHNAAFSEDGKYVFTGDEIGSSGNHTRVWNISDPLNVYKVSDIIVNPSAVVHNCYVKGDRLIIGHYTEGVRIWDIADPENPSELGYFDTFAPGGFGYNGCWSVYPYFKSGKIIASDMQYGLYVLTTFFVQGGGGGCCEGIRGDTDGDGQTNPTILDLTFLVDAIFRGGPAAGCLEEADANGDGDSGNIVDLTFLIDLIFRGGPPPGNCPN